MSRINNDLEFCAAVDVVDLHQFHQPDFGALVFDNKAAFALVVDVLVVQVGKLNKGFVRFFEPIAHHAGVVVHLVDERQIIPFQWA
ncbi:hypothetical protein D3C78_1209000 [compost metagenome]